MNTHASHRPAFTVALSCLLGACTVGPNYHRPLPASPPAAQYKELAGWMQASPADAAPKGDWWTDFHDPLLDALEPQVRIANQAVRQDYANYQQALALVRAANALLFPTLSVSGSAVRSRTPAGAGSSGTTAAVVGNQFTLEATASWTPDIWGKVRRQIEENAANAQASEATLANATLAAQVALANAVINLRVADANIDLLKRTVEAYEEYSRVISSAVKVGYDLYPPSDEFQARAQLETTQASLLNVGIARAQYVHAIAVLAGKNPEDLDVAHTGAVPTLPQIPVGVPSLLLQRRPDIASAERTMAAQNAAIGIAVGAYYPDLLLSGVDGSTASSLAGLFAPASRIWSLSASATETVIDFGARRAQVDASKAAYAAAVASYRGVVLSAFQGVEDNLASLRILEQQAKVQDAAVRDATRAAEILRSEYEIGTIDYTTVAVADANQLAARQSALVVAQSRLLAAVSLIGDLGGGWSTDQLHDPRRSSTASKPSNLP